MTGINTLNDGRDGLSDQELFIRNSEILNKLLQKSSIGNTAEYYRKQLFYQLNDEERDIHDREKKEKMQDIYKTIRIGHLDPISNKE